MPKANYLCAADALSGWRDELMNGTPPVLYKAGAGELERIEIGPGLVTLFGGAPGAGKTAFTMQLIVDALRLSPNLRAAICNVEMSPGVLLDRQLSRLSGIDLSLIRHRKLGPAHADRLDQALATLEPLVDRLAFVRHAFDLENVAATVDAFEADILVLDYLQRIAPPGDHGDRRGAVDASMAYLRQFADAGVAVVVVAAVSRSKDRKGRSSYAEGLNLASFRESGELEFGADDAFLLLPDVKDSGGVVLQHLKSRHGEPIDIELSFDRRLQRFTPANAQFARQDTGKVKAELAALWATAKPAHDNDAEEDEA